MFPNDLPNVPPKREINIGINTYSQLCNLPIFFLIV